MPTYHGKMAEQRGTASDCKGFAVVDFSVHVLLLVWEQRAQTEPGLVVSVVDADGIAETVLRLSRHFDLQVLEAQKRIRVYVVRVQLKYHSSYFIFQ